MAKPTKQKEEEEKKIKTKTNAKDIIFLAKHTVREVGVNKSNANCALLDAADAAAAITTKKKEEKNDENRQIMIMTSVKKKEVEQCGSVELY